MRPECGVDCSAAGAVRRLVDRDEAVHRTFARGVLATIVLPAIAPVAEWLTLIGLAATYVRLFGRCRRALRDDLDPPIAATQRSARVVASAFVAGALVFGVVASIIVAIGMIVT